MVVWCTQNLRQDSSTSHVTTKQRCNHFGGYSKRAVTYPHTSPPRKEQMNKLKKVTNKVLFDSMTQFTRFFVTDSAANQLQTLHKMSQNTSEPTVSRGSRKSLYER